MRTANTFLLGLGLATIALVQMAKTSSAQENDPPARVARMNYVQGAVSFQPGGEGDWLSAVPNRPLTTGDNLWTDQNSRSELHIGSTALRMGPETSLTFLNLDDRNVQLARNLIELSGSLGKLIDDEFANVVDQVLLLRHRAKDLSAGVFQHLQQPVRQQRPGQRHGTAAQYSYPQPFGTGRPDAFRT